jgi:hypothetical protein
MFLQVLILRPVTAGFADLKVVRYTLNSRFA